MSNSLDFYRAIMNSVTKNAPPPETGYTGEAIIIVLVLAIVGLFTVGQFLIAIAQ